MIKKRLFSLAAAAVLVVAMASFASAGIPSASESSASSGSGCITITPAGSGPSFASKSLTVSITVNDSAPNPIAGYPFQDIVVGDDVDFFDISICNGGSVADANTNASGQTTFSGTIAGGGNTQTGLNVYLAGVKLTGPALLIDMNSADINGDLVVDLGDVGDFAIDFGNTPTYDFRSDFTCDGTEDLADVGDLAIANGQSCP